MTHEQRVRHTLENSPHTRNSDKALMVALWRDFYGEFIENNEWVNLKDITNLPGLDGISRIRRKVQESGEYMPTEEKVARQRARQAGEVRENINSPAYEDYLPI